ncbi:hypothetical protein KKE14_02255 [Patescibacteria group bacterium]|nr:hypothetical protein [Patescibacteria group bacterium]
MIDERFVILALVFNFVGLLIYLIETLKGNTKPNKISWFIWSVAPLTAFFAQLYEGVGIHSLMTFSVGFGPLLIFIASFVNKKAYWRLERFDMLAGVLAIVALALWYITRSGNVAILFAILADFMAAIPTIIKSHTNPESESYSAYLFSAIGALITIFAIDIWSFEYYAFPVYIFLICVVLTCLIKFKLGYKLQTFFTAR